MTTVTDLQETNKLLFRRGVYNIIDCGVRTGKTYWAVNNLAQFCRDGKLSRILFLVDTLSLKESVLAEYSDKCCDADDFWLERSHWGELPPDKIGVMCYQSLMARMVRQELDFLEELDVICWDECDSIFDFAAAAFAQARRTDFARKEVSNEEVLTVIQKFSSKKAYAPLVMLGKWEQIVGEGRIMCIGLSGTPERTRAYYSSLISSANTGKLQVMLRTMADIYFQDLRAQILQLKPIEGRGYWCYSPWIEENKSIVQLANSLGFNAIELHSSNNADKPMTDEQKRVSNIIVTTGMVPREYDFIVVNKAYERGYNIRDPRFTTLIVNSVDKVEREQAGRMTHGHSRMLRTFAPPIPASYLDRWLTFDECRELAEKMNISDRSFQNSNRVMSWNQLQSYLPACGYKVTQGKKVFERGKRAKTAYFITGEWHDAEIENGNFLALAAAKNSQLLGTAKLDRENFSEE